MSRARNIKPGFFKNDKLADCHPLARILFAGLWCEADREGRLEDRPKRIKAEYLPYDDCDIDALIQQLADNGFIDRYEVDGNRYVQIGRFAQHQNPHHMESPSRIPPPTGSSNRYNHDPISPKQRARIYERDGHACAICSSNEQLQIDHIVMVSNGGTSDDYNLRTLCAQCNNKRSKKGKPETNPADSLIPDSPFLIPDSIPTPVVPASGDDPVVAVVLAAYHEALPNCEHVNVRTPKRCKRIQVADKLAKSICAQQGWPYERAEFWSAYFAECATDPWMRGDIPNPKNPRWRQNLDVLIAEDRFAGVMDRAISNMQRSNA